MAMPILSANNIGQQLDLAGYNGLKDRQFRCSCGSTVRKVTARKGGRYWACTDPSSATPLTCRPECNWAGRDEENKLFIFPKIVKRFEDLVTANP